MALGDSYRFSGQQAKAVAAYQHAIELAYKTFQLNSQNAEAWGYLAMCYAKTGNHAQAAQDIARARAIDGESNELMYEEATVRALAGRTKEAVAGVEQAALRSGYPLKEIEGDPDLKSVRETPEFAKLAAEISSKLGK